MIPTEKEYRVLVSMGGVERYGGEIAYLHNLTFDAYAFERRDVYTCLRRMARYGWVAIRQGRPSEDQNKTYYRVTRSGRRAVFEKSAHLRMLWSAGDQFRTLHEQAFPD